MALPGWYRNQRPSSELNFCSNDSHRTDLETSRYGIGSFVYQARRPFHPKRLWELVSEPFAILQTTFEDEDSDDSDDEAEEADIAEPEDVEMRDETKEKSETLARLLAEKAALDLPARAAFKRASPVWKGLLRSKGTVQGSTSLPF